MPIVASLARATLLEAVRNRLLWLAVVVVVIAFGLAQFLNQVAITESREIQTALLAAAAQGCRRLHGGCVRDYEHGAESSDKVTELLLSLPAAAFRLFFRKVCRLRHARLDPRCAQRAPLGNRSQISRDLPSGPFLSFASC